MADCANCHGTNKIVHVFSIIGHDMDKLGNAEYGVMLTTSVSVIEDLAGKKTWYLNVHNLFRQQFLS